MFDIHWRVSKFNEDKRWFLYQKIILTIIMRQALQGKNYRNVKNKKLLLFSPRVFLMLSNMWFPLSS